MKTEGYTKDEVAKVVQVRAGVEGLTLGPGVLDRIAGEGEKASLRFVPSLSTILSLMLGSFLFRYALQLLTPASILAQLAGRSEITVEDIGEMNELFLDAKTSAAMMTAFDGGVTG